MAHGGMKLIKFLLFLFNFIFWLTGLGLIVFGVIVKIQNTNYYNFLGNSFLAAFILLIASGCAIAILGFFGCCGAIRENYCMTMTFAILLGIMFILELAAGIASYVLRNDLETTITRHVSDGMNNYANETTTVDVYTKAWDYMQKNLNCCGAVNYTEWENKIAFKTLPPISPGVFALPSSCCSDGANSSGICSTASPQLHHNGCIEQLKRWAEINVASMGGVALGVALIQILGILLSCCYGMRIRYEEDCFYHNYH